MLASDAERDQALAVLRDAAGEGRLTLEELADRSHRALEARSREELEEITADVPAPPPAVGARPARRWLSASSGAAPTAAAGASPRA